MARPKVEINPIRGLRVKQLCKELQITQKELAEKTRISIQAISGMINGKKNVTETSACAINNAFPQYRVGWILGIDEYKNQLEENVSVLKKGQHDAALLEAGLRFYASVNGFTISRLFDGLPKRMTVEMGLTAIKNGYTISKDDKKAQISIEEMNNLVNDISDYVEYRLNRYLKKGR